MRITNVLRGEDGSVLVITMLLLVGLTALGGAFMTSSRVETQITGNSVRHAQALSLAEAGINEAVGRLAIPASPNYIGEDMTAPNPGWGRYIVLRKGCSAQDPDHAATATDGLDNDLDAATDETSESYPEILSVQSGVADPLYYPWIRVTYKLDSNNNILRFGDHDDNRATPDRRNLIHGAPILTVTARGEQASANRTIEVDLVRPPAFDIHACLYTEDDDFHFGGDDFLISGQDFNPVTKDTVSGSTRKPAIVTTADPVKLLSMVGHQQGDQIIGSGGSSDIQAAPEDLNLEWYVDTWSRFADFHYIGDTKNPNEMGAWGDYDNYHVIYVENGDLTLKGEAYGGGLLLIDGNVEIVGSFTWYGVIIALGDVYLKGGGDLPDQFHVFGGLFCNGAVENYVVGNADLFYSSEAIDRLNTLQGVLPLAWREK